jgi:hypothetical protein
MDIMAKKLILDTDEKLWKCVQKFKIDKGLRSNNLAVNTLIKRGLKCKPKKKGK